MEGKEILRFCIENGLLVDEEILKLFSETTDIESAKLIISKIKETTQQKVITKSIFNNDRERVSQVFLDLPAEHQQKLEKLKIKLGLSIEISKEISKKVQENVQKEPLKIISAEGEEEIKDEGVRVFSMKFPLGKKLEVKDFVNYFRARLTRMKNILQDRSGLDNLVSINKISGSRQGISIIGIVYGKKTTKNKNILLDIEDLTGRIRVLINKDKKELYEKAEKITLDSVIAIKGSGNREIIFANDVIFPESILHERRKAPVEEYALFIGDIHIGSKLFMEENFLKFIDYLNGKIPNTPEVPKIKYLFVVGDVVTGVGNYPNQEKELAISDLESQFEKAAELFSKIRKDIKIIISTGNHDGVRLMEPQPPLNKKYAWPLYELENVIFTTNPSKVSVGVRGGFSGINVLTYHGVSIFHYAHNIAYLMKNKAVHKPEMIMAYLLENRHLAPTHTSIQYFPFEEDPHFIENVPDIFVIGHSHKSAIVYYNNILMISISSWESKTGYMEKLGMEPDFCKVPMVNLKTRAIKILDFE